MITEIFRAFFAAGVPVGVCSFLLAWWALKNNYFGNVESIKGLEQEVKRLTKSRKKNKKNLKAGRIEKVEPDRPDMNPVHNKWLSFGGGFYGVVALLTYAVIELGEVRDFIANLGGFFNLISNLSIDLLIRFVIDSFMNFIMAIAWPMYWINEISSSHIWIWFLAAYAGYWAGTRYALHRASSPKV